ncbi:Gfo/Idh/MocA family protein [Salinibacter ruber]|uniref:Gfo/Idh/MocA family protein n=1 Tax=Salinibacter ruber TaxID=146919 RepID=UPI000E5886A1|nr:Gfo/Idh/MocA family oxidoreductase [Salinibacter ruber]
MLNIGIIGVSEGNGHPFSFSAIVNGYDDEGLRQSGWKVIYDYVRERHPSEFGFDGVQVSHVWTQEPEQTRRLQAACNIPRAVEHWSDLKDAVDAVILARDDHERHAEMALPLLEAGLPVFVDKPLSLDSEDLRRFRPYLEDGQLMSCSGLRYARELDEARAHIGSYGALRCVRGAVVLGWEKYAIHLLEAVSTVLPSVPVSVAPVPAEHESVAITMSDGTLFQLDALGDVPKTFQVDFWGTDRRSTHEITDNFTAFRRTLWEFVEMIRTGVPAIDPAETLRLMQVLRAGRRALQERRPVSLDNIEAA